MVQTIRPASTISSGSWSPIGAATMHETTDETSQDGDTTRNEAAQGAGTFEVKLDAASDPTSNINHTIHVWGKGVGSGQGESVDLYLYVATTLIVKFANNWTPGRSAYAENTYTLSAAEADAIGDYADLRIRVEEAAIGSGSERLNVTQIYMDIPDVSGGVTHDGAAVLSGTATMAAAAAMIYAAGSVLSGTATLAALAQLPRVGAAVLSGTATLGAVNQVIRDGAAALSGTATITPAGAMVYGAGSTLSGTATMISAGAVTYGGGAVLSGTATLTAAGEILGTGTTHNAAAVLSGTATLGAQAQRIQDGASVLSGTASLAAVGELLLGGQVSLSGTATLTSVAGMTYASVGVLSGTATLVADGEIAAPPPVVGGGGTPPFRRVDEEWETVVDPPVFESEFMPRFAETKRDARVRAEYEAELKKDHTIAKDIRDATKVDTEISAADRQREEEEARILARRRTNLINLEKADRARAKNQARRDAIQKQKEKSLKKARAAKKRKRKKK